MRSRAKGLEVLLLAFDLEAEAQHVEERFKTRERGISAAESRGVGQAAAALHDPPWWYRRGR